MVAIKYEFVDKPAVAAIWLSFYNHNAAVLLLHEIAIMYYVVDFAKPKKKNHFFFYCDSARLKMSRCYWMLNSWL